MTPSHGLLAEWEDFRPEVRLLLYCARSTLDVGTRERIAALLAGDIDWTHLTAVALDHRVAPLLYQTFRGTGMAAVPDELADALAYFHDDNLARNRHLADVLLAIVDDLARESVPVIPLKGPILASLAYGDLSLRTAGDLDFLVHEADVQKVCRLLMAQGFAEPEGADPVLQLRTLVRAAYRTYQSEYLFFRDRDRVAVEPHWALVPRTLAMPCDHGGIWQRARPVAFDGRSVLHLGIEDLLLFLCVHGSKHQWIRLQWVCDIAELIAAHPHLDWGTCLERARRQGCRRMLLLGLALARGLLGSVLPDEVAHAVDGDRPVRTLAAASCRHMFGNEGPVTPLVKVSPFRVRMRERVRDKAAYILRTVTTPTLAHYSSVHIPDRLFFLYYPFKLAHDYALLPAWNVTRWLRRRGGDKPVSAQEAARTTRAVRDTWGARSGRWARWAEDQGPSVQRLNDLLLDAVGVTSGQTVLDLASGVGEPALATARRLAGSGLVVATDLVPEMLAAVDRRADGSGVTGVACCAADMQALPFPDGRFDGVLCRLGVMFAPRPDLVLAEARRVLKPTAAAAFLVWGPMEENTAFHGAHQIVGRFMEWADGDTRMAAFRFSTPGQLAEVVRGAGFVDVEDQPVRIDDVFAAGSKFWRPMLEMTYGIRYDDLPPAMRDGLDGAMETVFAPHLQGDGYHLATSMRLVVGRRAPETTA